MARRLPVGALEVVDTGHVCWHHIPHGESSSIGHFLFFLGLAFSVFLISTACTCFWWCATYSYSIQMLHRYGVLLSMHYVSASLPVQCCFVFSNKKQKKRLCGAANWLSWILLQFTIRGALN
ncbi:hypothetical protein V8C42DRAFT_17261 [Trichoderma barbatum]